MSSTTDQLFGPLTEGRNPAEAEKALRQAAAERILILDGAMGTEIQLLGLSEDDFRGHRFGACECHLQGNNDLLNLSQPKAIEDIHYAYAIAGADILETNTFSSTSIAQADYQMEDQVYDLNRDGARPAAPVCARRKRTASAVSSPAHSGPPTAPPRSRRTSTIPAFGR